MTNGSLINLISYNYRLLSAKCIIYVPGVQILNFAHSEDLANLQSAQSAENSVFSQLATTSKSIFSAIDLKG